MPTVNGDTMLTGETLAELIDAQRWRGATNEFQVQAELASLLAAHGINAHREVRLTPSDRIDFLVGPVGVEVKTAGSTAMVDRQLRRYAVCPDVHELLLVTTRARHGLICDVGVPLTVVTLIGGLS